MIYMLCSLYKEAEPIIELYKLKKNSSYTSFQVFEGDYIKLIISGIGKVNAACAVSYIISKNDIKSEDAFINIGTSGSSKRYLGEAVLINKIKDMDTLESFYPDILIKHKFEEGYLETYSNIVTQRKIDDLCDMEGSAFFKSAAKFMCVNQIFVIKIVSDNLTEKRLDGNHVKNCISKNLALISNFIENYLNSIDKVNFFNQDDEDIILAVTHSLRLTESQALQFKRAYIALKLRGGYSKFDFGDFVKMKVNLKIESKKYFKELIEAMWRFAK